jgi:hypothetical protein
MDNELNSNSSSDSSCQTARRSLPLFDIAIKKSISTQTHHKCTKEMASQTIIQSNQTDNIPICKTCYQNIEDRMCYYTSDGDFCSKRCLYKHRDKAADKETAKDLEGISYVPYECVNCKSMYPFRILRFEGSEYCSDKCLVDMSCKKMCQNIKNDHQIEMSRLCIAISLRSVSLGIIGIGMILFIWKKLKR